MTEPTQTRRLVQAYDRMMERVKLRLEELEQAEREALPQLRASIEHAAEKAVELGELTREEARLIGGYLKRDLEDAGQYLTTTGQDLRAWLRFDLELLEDRMLDFFSAAWINRGWSYWRSKRRRRRWRPSGIAAARSLDPVPAMRKMRGVNGLFASATIAPCPVCGASTSYA